MSRRPPELDLEALGDLTLYSDDELSALREKLIDDISRIEGEAKQCDKRIKDFNIRKQELQQERADRSRAIRAVRNVVMQRSRLPVTPPRGKLWAAKR
jgi:uncharacterized protein YeeX (DUF496 family)